MGITREGRVAVSDATTGGEFTRALLSGAGTEIPQLLQDLGDKTFSKGASNRLKKVTEEFAGFGAAAQGLAGAETRGGRVLTVSGARDITNLIERRGGEFSSAQDVRDRLSDLGDATRLIESLSPQNEQQRNLQEDLSLKLAGEVEQLEEALKIISNKDLEQTKVEKLTNIDRGIQKLIDAIVGVSPSNTTDDTGDQSTPATETGFVGTLNAALELTRKEREKSLSVVQQQEVDSRKRVVDAGENLASSIDQVATRISQMGPNVTPNP